MNNNSKDNDNIEKSQDGLPDISNGSKYEPKLMFVSGIILVLGLYGWWHLHHANALTNTNNESFHVEDTAAPPLKITASNSNIKTNTVVPSDTQITDEADIQKALLSRLQAPIMVGNNDNVSNTPSSDNSNLSSNNSSSQNIDPNTQYLNQVSSESFDVSQATVLKNRNTLIAQGNLIHAILESAVNSDLPGLLRAIISEPVYSEDGSQVLITPGSRLIGQYKSGMLAGQNRIFIVWTRIIEPNGISIQIGSPGVDSLGVSGQGADTTDYHFWQMFGTATMLSILGAGASNVGVNNTDQFNASQAYRESVATSLAQTAQNSLQQNINIPPTLHINQGTPILVFVAKDLRFDKAMPQINTMNIL